jgi:hypothetical protein
VQCVSSTIIYAWWRSHMFKTGCEVYMKIYIKWCLTNNIWRVAFTILYYINISNSETIWGSHSSDYEDYSLQVCNAVQFCKPSLQPALAGFFLGLFLTLKMKWYVSSKMFGYFWTTRCYNPEDCILSVGHCLLSKLTNFLEQNPSREADNCYSDWEMICLLRKPKTQCSAHTVGH